MAITLDTIVNKVFKVVKNGYDNNEVESFLDEILEEMENREAETNKLKEQVAQFVCDDLDPLGKEIIDCCLHDGTLDDYLALTPMKLK